MDVDEDLPTSNGHAPVEEPQRPSAPEVPETPEAPDAADTPESPEAAGPDGAREVTAVDEATATAPVATPGTTKTPGTTRTPTTTKATKAAESSESSGSSESAAVVDSPKSATAPRPTGSSARRRAAAMSPTPGGTATLERPRTRKTTDTPRRTPERAPSNGRLARSTRAVGAALGRFGRSRALPVTMVVAIVVCAALAGLAYWQGREAWTEGPVANGAVVDVSGTAEVVGQTRESLEKILSYDYSRLNDSVDAARTMSTGAFTQQWMQVFDGAIRGPAAEQQLRQTATVLNIGVLRLDEDHAQLMAVVQFSAERQRTGQTTNAPGLLRLDVDRVDGRWKLAQLTPLTAEGSSPPAAPN